MEVKCINKILNMVNLFNNNNDDIEKRARKKQLHFVSIGSSTTLSMIKTYIRNSKNKSDVINITGSTCPHYLIFDSSACSNGCTVLKCSPPIRDYENCIGLRQNMIDDTEEQHIFIGSAHVECDARLKLMHTGDLVRSMGGVHSIMTYAPTAYTSMVLCNHSNNIDPQNNNNNNTKKNIIDLVEKCCIGPAQLLGMVPNSNDGEQRKDDTIIKGMLVVNGDADICIFNTSLLNSNIHVNKYQSRLSPYRKANQRIVNPAQGSPTIPTLYGNVVGVLVKGKMVYNVNDNMMMRNRNNKKQQQHAEGTREKVVKNMGRVRGNSSSGFCFGDNVNGGGMIRGRVLVL